MKGNTYPGNEKCPEKVEDEKGRFRKLFSVNTRMLPAKLAYTLYGGNLGSHITFLNVFFTSVGLSTSQAGLITGIRFVASSFTQLFWGYISDYTGRRKLILTVLCIGAALPIFSMPWVSNWIYTPSHFALCSGNSTSKNETAITNRGSMEYLNALAKCEIDKERDINTLFYTLLGIVTFASGFLVPLPCYVETIVMNVAKTSAEKASYGGQRIFGSIGFSLANILAGIGADKYRVEDMSNYTAVFYLFLPYTLMLIPVGWYLIGQTDYGYSNESDEKKEDKEPSAGNSDNLSKQIFEILCRFDVLFFMATVLLSGLANNLFINFAYMYVKDEMKKTKTEMTLVVVAATASEILIFPFTTKIIKIVGGNYPAIIIGMISYFVRFIVMAYDAPFDILVAVQTLHSLGFALSFAAMMEHIHDISPGQINATMNSIMMSLFFSVSNLFANILGGYIYQKYGGKNLFFGKAVICAIWSVLMIFYFGWKRVRSRYLHSGKPSFTFRFSAEERRKRNETIRGIGIENPISCLDDEHNVEVTVAI